MLLGFSIGTRLALSAGLMIVLLIGISILGIVQQHATNTELQLIVHQQIPKLRLINGMRDAARFEATAIRDITLQADIAFMKGEVKRMKEARQQYESLRTELISQLSNNAAFMALIPNIEQEEKKIRKSFETILEMVLNEDQAGAFAQIKEVLRPSQDNLFKALNELRELVQQGVDQEAVQSEKRYEKAVWFSIALGVFALVVGMLVSFLTAREITRPMRQMQRVIDQVAHEGRFDVRVNLSASQKDEVGQTAAALNGFLAQLQTTIRDINHTLHQVGQGHFDQRMTETLPGELDSLRLGVNSSVDSVSLTIAALGEVMQGLYQGNFSLRMDERVPEHLRAMVDQSVESLHGVILNINQVMDAMARGDFEQRITYPARGELSELVKHTNDSLTTLSAAITASVSVAQAMSEGDFTQQISGQYFGALATLQQSINQAISKMNGVLGEIVEVSNTVYQAATEIHHGNQDLNDRTQQQAATIDKTAHNLRTMNEAIAQTAHHSLTSDQLAKQAQQETRDGTSIMQQTLVAMTQMQEASQRVSEITSLIDSISFQTNLLALNAAVEAARAGEHGRGFAVVAGEVRALAGKSSDAARDIRALIDNTIEQVRKGTQLANQSGDSLNHIQQSIVKVGDLVTAMASQSQQQRGIIDGLNQDMGAMESTTQQNAALVEEISAATARMQDQTENLTALVNQFKLAGGQGRVQAQLGYQR